MLVVGAQHSTVSLAFPHPTFPIPNLKRMNRQENCVASNKLALLAFQLALSLSLAPHLPITPIYPQQLVLAFRG